MSDPATLINGVISMTTAATETVKLLQATDSRVRDAAHKNELAELVQNLADLKSNAADLKLALTEKDNRIRELEEQLRVKAQVVFRDNVIFLEKDSEAHGPYCPNCWENNGKLIHLHVHSNGYRECKTCDKRYGFSAVDEARLDAIERADAAKRHHSRNKTTGY